jgi:hypothetical protein
MMLFAFEAIAVPVDQAMLDYLIKNGVIAEGTSPADAQKFLENHLKAGECYDFYTLVRREALGRDPDEVDREDHEHRRHEGGVGHVVERPRAQLAAVQSQPVQQGGVGHGRQA